MQRYKKKRKLKAMNAYVLFNIIIFKEESYMIICLVISQLFIIVAGTE